MDVIVQAGSFIISRVAHYETVTFIEIKLISVDYIMDEVRND